jgi:lipopolysaccharide export system protein LptC
MAEPAIRPNPTGKAEPPAMAPVQTSRSYSRFVALMRVGLPVVAAAIITIVIAWPQLSEAPKGFRLGISEVAPGDSGDQRIVNANFTGTGSEGRPYTITADSAWQAQKSPDSIQLAFPKADLTLNTGAWLAMSAETGVFDRQSQLLDLEGAVNLFHDIGYELHTPSAHIDLVNGSAQGDDPVQGQGPGGTMTSKGFRIMDRGQRIMFTGKSRLVLYPAKGVPGTKKPGGAK